MEGQFNARFEKKMELELIQVDPDELCGFFGHYVRTTSVLKERENIIKNVTDCDGLNHHLIMKYIILTNYINILKLFVNDFIEFSSGRI